MSPEERQMLSNLFDRVRSQANAPRDRDAEALIAEAVRTQPYAPYLLAQAVLVQEQALQAADQRIQEMQAHIGQLEADVRQAQTAQQGSGGFLGGLFGGGSRPAAPPPQNFGAGPGPGAPGPNPWGAAPPQAGYGQAPQGYGQPPQAQGGPWGAPQPQAQGGGFLKGALGAAAGVAGGMLLVDSIRGLMGGGHGAANAAGLGNMLGGGTEGEKVVNNFFGSPSPSQNAGNDAADYQDAADDDFSDGGDDYGDDI